ncbi:MAG: amidase [Gemmatimonadota bacterium]|jgi:amidase
MSDAKEDVTASVGSGSNSGKPLSPDSISASSSGSSLLSRREFLGTGAAAGGALVLGSAAGCAPSEGGRPGTGVAGAVQAGEPWPLSTFELEEVSIVELREGMESGRWSAVEITEAYLSRIEEIDRQGPTLRSVIETNPEALEVARVLDQERADGQVRGPLHGIPILLKDNIATHDRMTTTAGSYALEGSIPPEDSGVARRLRAAGAILLGKANLSEWANFRSTRSSSGWSGRGGQCKNPYVLDRNPCGSSSGSGAAASASLCGGAIGTETNGSIVCPSNANGVVGIKPTVGLVSRSRIIPISHTQDTAGPMARTVTDAVLLLGAITGLDPDDPATNAGAERAERDYTPYLDPRGLEGSRIGLATQYAEGHERVEELFQGALEVMRGAGSTVVEIPEVDAWRRMGGPSGRLMRYEFKTDLNAYLEGLGPEAPVKSLQDIIDFNEANASQELPFFQQEILYQCQELGPLSADGYREALEEAMRLSRDEGIDAVMAEHRLDAIVAPTGSPAWTTDLINGDRYHMGSSSPAAISGYPNISVPMGFFSELPVNISIWGRAWTEPDLIRIAYAFEQLTRHRQAPKFMPTLDL